MYGNDANSIKRGRGTEREKLLCKNGGDREVGRKGWHSSSSESNSGLKKPQKQ